MVSRCQGSMAPTRRRTGARENGASLGSDQQAAHPRGVGRLPGDRALELVRRSGEVCQGSAPAPCVLIQHDVYGTGNGDGEEVTHRTPEKRTPKTMAPPDRRREPLPGEPFSTAGARGVLAHCPLCGTGLVPKRDAGEESRGRYVHAPESGGVVCRDLGTVYFILLPDDRHPVRATDRRLEEHRGAEKAVGTDHAKTEETRRAT